MELYCLNVSKLNVTEMKNYISTERLNKTNKLLRHEDKQLSIGSELLLNHLLAMKGIKNLRYLQNINGKPYLSNNDSVKFNISHSHKIVAVLIDKNSVGVDIEYITPNIDLGIAKTYFTTDEYEYILNNKDPNLTFFKIWVLKESYLKMINQGFNVQLDDFSVINSKGQIELNQEGIYTENIKFGLFTDDEYFLATCCRNDVNQLNEITLNDIKQGLKIKW